MFIKIFAILNVYCATETDSHSDSLNFKNAFTVWLFKANFVGTEKFDPWVFIPKDASVFAYPPLISNIFSISI